MLNILLIGATGKLGKNVFSEILIHKDKYCLGVLIRNSSTNQNFSNAKVFNGDILNDSISSAISWADIVVNCSGFVSYKRKDKELLYSINVDGIRNILSLCEEYGKPLIHTSSAIAYGSSRNPILFTENSNNKNVYRGEYAQSKFEADRMIIQSKISYIIIRPGTLISTLTNLYAFYQKGFIAELRGGASFTPIKETAQAYIKAINIISNEPIQQIYNLGGINLSFAEVFSFFRRYNTKPAIMINSSLLNFLSFVSDMFLTPIFNISILTRENYITGNHYTFINSSRAQQYLDYQIPPFEELLKNVIGNDNNRR